jgi:uncharacterized membrane protein
MSKEDTTMGVEPNLGGLLCYAPCCIGLIVSIVVAIVEKKSRFVRFHAFQSLLVHGAGFALFLVLAIIQIVAGMVFAPLALLVWGLEMLVGLAFLALTIFLMMKAHANEEYKLPRLGDLALQWI